MTVNPSLQSPENRDALGSLSDRQQRLLTWMQARDLPFTQIVAYLQQPQDVVRLQLAQLIQQGWVAVVGEDTYRAIAPDQQDLQASLPQALIPGRQSSETALLPSQWRSQLTLSPPSQPQQPLHLLPGAEQTLQVTVGNHSDQADVFCLSYPPPFSRWLSTYPQPSAASGAVVDSHCLSLQPGEQGLLWLTLSPPTDALAGSYRLTVKLTSQHHPDWEQVASIYLQVDPVYNLQPQLQALVGQVQRQPAWFHLLLSNQGNAARTLRLTAQNLDEPGMCDYRLEPEEIAVPPYTTAEVTLKGQPRQGRKRPWLGPGRQLNFCVDIADLDGHPLPMHQLPGSFTWLPRPGWQWLLALSAGLGLLGSLVWLLWWFVLRPPVAPQIVEFFPEESDYSAARDEVIELGWEIEHPETIHRLKIVGYNADGKLVSGPLTYDFADGIPADLADACVTTETVLSCGNVATDARHPGDYVFEMTLVPEDETSQGTQQAMSSQVSIAELPRPQVVELAPGQVLYAEAGTPPAATAIPPVSSQGILLSWVVAAPQQLQDLLLIVREADGTVLGGRRFSLRSPENPRELTLPPGLEPFCQLGGALVCQNVPSGIGDVGQFSFELAPVMVGQSEPLEGQTSELVEVLPRPVRIAQFQINGQPAQPRYLIPVEPGQPGPPLVVSWQVEGGSTATAQLLPSPGTVPLSGELPLPLSPEPGVTTLTLQVSDGVNEPLVRSVTIQTFDPTAAAPAIPPTDTDPDADSPSASPPERPAPAFEFPTPSPAEEAAPADPSQLEFEF